MKKICIFTLYSENGGSSQYRTYMFRDEIEKIFFAEWYPFWNKKYIAKYSGNKKKYLIIIGVMYIFNAIQRIFQLLMMAPKADVVYIQKSIIPGIGMTFLSRTKKAHKFIIFDVDDAIYIQKHDNSSNIAKDADLIICGNETLKKHYEKINKNTVVLPTVDKTYRYEGYYSDTFTNKVIGWIGSKSQLNNLDLVIEPINRIIEEHPEVEFHIICNTTDGYEKKINNCKLIPWSAETYLDSLSKITVGIMPLKKTPFNEGKCGFKLVQYLSMRKPVIGSPVGVNSQIIDGNGYNVESNEEWEKSLESLLFDEEVYKNFIQHIDNSFMKEYHYRFVADKLIMYLCQGKV